MQLQEFLRGIPVLTSRGPLPAHVAGVHYDSRRIQPGWAFVAIRGEVADGLQFVEAARRRGAAVIIADRPAPDDTAPWIQVSGARAALAQLSANWFGRPAEQLRLVGVTGTNGKTTTSWLIEALLRAAGIRPGLLGTIEYHIGEAVLPSPHTTPESYDLQELLAHMRAAGCGAAVMEVSSHALAMDRVWGCPFEVAVFTNLTQDHLDYHQTMEAYAEAKRRLFQGLGAPPPRTAVVNTDDPWAKRMTAGFGGNVLGFGLGPEAQLRAVDLVNEPSGLRFTLQGPDGYRRPLATALLGRVNALNLLAAIGAGWSLGLDPDAVVAAAASLPRVRGRFERVFAGQPFTVVVDYAHTPDALTNVLGLARELARGKVRVVFGCGGDRDRGKRPLMAHAASAGADAVLVTSDNPRSEAPLAIIEEIVHGLPAARAQVDPDRASAIRTAVRAAQPGDVVVIAGKGHEDYQIIGDQKLPFDDVREARAALHELGWTAGGGQ